MVLALKPFKAIMTNLYYVSSPQNDYLYQLNPQDRL